MCISSFPREEMLALLDSLFPGKGPKHENDVIEWEVIGFHWVKNNVGYVKWREVAPWYKRRFKVQIKFAYDFEKKAPYIEECQEFTH